MKMVNPEMADSSQESQEKSQKQLADQKFLEISEKIEQKDLGYRGNNGEIISFSTTPIHYDGGKTISIVKDGEPTYSLVAGTGKYTLYYGPKLEKVIENVTPEELLNNILPNFEKRLNEGEILKVKERQRAIEDANQYAYQQDQKSADRLLQENGLV